MRLSDIVRDHNGKVHGSRSHIVANHSMSLIVYLKFLQKIMRDEVKQRFNNLLYLKQQYLSNFFLLLLLLPLSLRLLLYSKVKIIL